jgi:hypothetical protein
LALGGASACRSRQGRWLRPGSLSTSLQELFDGGLFDLPAVRVLHQDHIVLG